ncbi:MAG: FAD-dependent oxidoreductase, partial [Ilumatobacteraceae bacterium]
MSQLPARVDVAIVGAGLAGLAAARHLHAKSFTVALLEAQDDVGGRVRTDLVDGFRLDRGFQILLTAYPELKRQVDLDALDLHNFDPGALVMMRGR